MRLLSIRLENVRRFAEPVCIENIGPGINVLSAPNERGKSTVFDALQAVFFVPYGSKAKAALALRPHAGGAPAASVEIETAEGRFRIDKRWLNSPMAEVRRDGRLIAKADDAEAWIARVAAPAGQRGPAGLLWVRQGLSGLDDGSNAERDAGRAARRDLLSSVTGEVEAMTGGRRMDRVRERCRRELETYVTPTGRPKTGGPLRAAEDEAAALTAREAELTRTAEALNADLDARRTARRELAELTHPDAAEARRERLAEAQAAHDAAQRHAERLERARQAERLARYALDTARTRLERLRRAVAEQSEAGRAAAVAEAAQGAAETGAKAAEAALAQAEAAARAAEAAARAADAVLNRALRAEAAAGARERREALAERLARAEAARAEREAATAEAAHGPDAKALRALEALAQKATVQREARAREAPGLTMSYAPGADGAVALDGAPLPGGERRPIPAGATLELRGLGRLIVDPGRGGHDEAALRAAEAKLAAALTEAGAESLEAARAAAERRSQAEARGREAQARLDAVAPEGLEALRRALAALPEPAAHDADLPAAPEAQATAEAAAAAHAAAQTALAEARRRAEQERQAAARAGAAREAATERLRRAREARADPALADAAEETLAAELETLDATLASAAAALADLAADAPDLAAAEAALARARAVADNAETEARSLRERLAALDAAIDLRAGEAVEEELADVSARLGAAREALARITFEVQVLQRLADALDAARAAARERYFEPVMAELAPLLRLLWDDAELHLDEDAVLPTALTRKGERESFEVLSGGTQEQIAMLVRLAFARMLAADGRHAPVILDDALVHTDDARIERMFDALHRQAGDLQIIVLSCRQRAFRDLGGNKLSLEPVRAAAAAAPPP